MENTGMAGIRATLIIKQSEVDFVINLLDALKLKGFVDFKVENESMPGPPSQELTATKLNAIIEKSEKSADISLEAFKAKHNL
jgi:hypothetical protein